MNPKTHTYEDNTAFIRVDGEDIVAGAIDIKTARLMLEGTQETVSYFLKKEDPDLAKRKELNYPIRTREGSWEVLIPFGTLVLGAAGGAFVKGLNAYAKKTGEKIAERQFAEKEAREMFESAFRRLDIVIKISQHLGVVDRKSPLDMKLVDYQKKSVLLKNSQGNVLSTTMDAIEVYRSCPERLLRSLASVVTDYRTLTIGYKTTGKPHEKVIDIDSKEIFSPEEEPQESILPELHDNEYITLRGYVTRGNQITNTIGFKYKDHVITCEPDHGLITGYLNAHYKTCDISGVVQRTPTAQVALGKRDRPRISFDKLTVVTDEQPQQQSFLTEDA